MRLLNPRCETTARTLLVTAIVVLLLGLLGLEIDTRTKLSSTTENFEMQQEQLDQLYDVMNIVLNEVYQDE